MKNTLYTLLAITILFFATSSFAQVYQTVQSGQWTNTSTWENGNIPPKKQNNITIRINEGHDVIFQANAKDHEMGNDVTIEVNGSFTKNGWNTFKVGNDVHFIVNGTMIFNTHSRFEAKNDAIFDIYGTFIHNSNSEYGNNTTFNIYENAVMENKQLIDAKNNTTFNIDGSFLNSDYKTVIGNNAEFNISETGLFQNSSNFIAGNNTSYDVEGSIINDGESWKFKTGDNAYLYVGENGTIETNTNMIYGSDFLLIVDGEATIAGWNFSFGQGSEIQVLGNLDVTNHSVFKSGNSDNVFYACEGSVNNPDFIKNVIYLDCDVLPVELLYFEAKTDASNDILLTWATASETNSDYFTLERSTDAQNWTALEAIPSAGNTNHLVEYSYTDKNTQSGIYYYRLVQIDFDGAFEIFDAVAVEKETLTTFEIYNVYRSQQQVVIQGIFQANNSVIVTDLMGNVYFQGVLSTDQSQISFRIDSKVSAIVVKSTDGSTRESAYSKKFSL